MDEKNIAISVRDLKIEYRIFNKYSIQKNLLQRKPLKSKVYRAVNNVSFDIPKGTILGIVGKNGSGKSTLLKALAGIISPDEGNIDLHDHSISLLAIGVGFKKQLTGRENIILSGMLLGFSEQEVQNHMDEIIEFSELGQFIDMPVKTYSSGMHSKLSFSITAVLETDIILIDEILSVGDEHFKKKSYARMKELISDQERTVIIVSHNLVSLTELCDSILWMNDGEIQQIGPPKQVIPLYKKYMK